MRVRCSDAIPAPKSRTLNSTAPAPSAPDSSPPGPSASSVQTSRALTTTRLCWASFACPYLIPFSIRLPSTCTMESVSAKTCAPVVSPISSSASASCTIPLIAATASRTSTSARTGLGCSTASRESTRAMVSRSSVNRLMRVAFFRIVPRNSRATGLSDSSWSSRVSTYPLIEVSGVRSSCDTLATKSRCVRSTSSIRVMSCSTATAPPAGIGDAFTSKMRPGASDVVLRSHTTRSSSAAFTHASTSGSRTVCTSACPTRTALAAVALLALTPANSRCIAWLAH